MKEAVYYNKLENKVVGCVLCPNNCVLKEGALGSCRIRQNNNGVLYTTTYHLYSGVGFDPIEKKPLYHFFPGKHILSVGSVGCNMHCQWCQNADISQNGCSSNISLRAYNSEDLLEKAMSDPTNIGIAYTYNEPSIAFETNIETARLFHKNGLKNILVTNGYINQPPLLEYLEYIDAVNLDVKSFNNDVHQKCTGATLDVILKNAKTLFSKNIHLELTYLVVNGVNDKVEEFHSFIRWVKQELSSQIPIHISRYFPRYKYEAPATSLETLFQFAEIASEELNYVYLGNVQTEKYKDTYCEKCGELLIERKGYSTHLKGLKSDGTCTNCGIKVEIDYK